MSDQDSGLSLGMLQQQMANPVDPGQLEMFGKKAAALYGQGSSLSDAVVEVVKEARLSPEQVKRVCEFANTSAYLQEFEKAGEVRNVTFEGPGPADPSVVLKELNDGSAPAIHQVSDEDYAPPGGSYKLSSADSLLAGAFGIGQGMDKTASAAPGHSIKASGLEEIYDLKVRLEGTRNHFMSKLSSSQVFLDDIQKDFCDAVEQEVVNGRSMGDISRACRGFGTPFMFKHAMKIASDHLEKLGTLNKVQQVNSMRKVSSAKVVNPNHPLIERFQAFVKVATEHRKLRHAIDILDEQLAEVRPELQRRLK